MKTNNNRESKNQSAYKEQQRTFGQVFDAAYYRDVLASLTGKKKVFHFGIPADTVRVEVKRECEGYFRISMKRGESSDVEYFREYIDWETILSTDRAARLLADYRADHHSAHQFKLGDLVKVNDEKWGQVNGHVGRIVRVVLQNQLVGSYYEVEFVGDLPKFDNGNPMKANNFEPLDIEPVEEVTDSTEPTLEEPQEITDNLPEWLKAGATVYSTKMWMYGDPFTIDGLSTTQPGCWHMTAPNGFTFSISPEDIGNEFATVAPAPHDKQGREVPQPELHIGDRVILGEFFKTDKPNTEGTIWGKEWDEEQEAWTYRIRVAECVYYDGRADQVTPVTPLEDTEEISTDSEGHEPTFFDEQSGKAERYERHNITAGEREAKAKGSASYIRRQARLARCAFYSHKGARIETSIAYRNSTDDPDGMSYKVCWYDETRTGELHLVECENGISLEQAARHMADFSLLSECGLTLREILYPAA